MATRVDELNKAWEAARSRPIAAEMTFAGDFLILGAQTRLAKVGAPVDEGRLGALLATAYGRPAPASSLRHVRRAVETWRDGEKPLALTHLALSGLAKLTQPKEDARRLFIADALIEAGVEPSDIVEGLRLGPTPPPEALDKYNPGQPRVPAGNTDGGQWTRGDGAETEDDSRPGRPSGAEVADASTTRNRAIVSDMAPGKPPLSAEGNAIQFAQNTSQTCEAYIAANRQARILRAFPGQFLQSSVQEVIAAAKAGDPAAKRACKLLFDNRWAK